MNETESIDHAIGHLVHGHREERIGHAFLERDHKHRRLLARGDRDVTGPHA
jgi:hypothetical protein